MHSCRPYSAPACAVLVCHRRDLVGQPPDADVADTAAGANRRSAVGRGDYIAELQHVASYRTCHRRPSDSTHRRIDCLCDHGGNICGAGDRHLLHAPEGQGKNQRAANVGLHQPACRRLQICPWQKPPSRCHYFRGYRRLGRTQRSRNPANPRQRGVRPGAVRPWLHDGGGRRRSGRRIHIQGGFKTAESKRVRTPHPCHARCHPSPCGFVCHD